MLYDPKWERRSEEPRPQGYPVGIVLLAWTIPAFIFGYTAAAMFNQIAYLAIPAVVGAAGLLWNRKSP